MISQMIQELSEIDRYTVVIANLSRKHQVKVKAMCELASSSVLPLDLGHPILNSVFKTYRSNTPS